MRSRTSHLLVTICVAVALAMLPAGVSVAGHKAQTTKNLIRNPGAESGKGARNDRTVVDRLPGWDRDGDVYAQATAVRYGAEGSFPDTHTPGPKHRGRNFFAGGPDNASQILRQDIDVSRYKHVISKGKVRFEAGAWLGGLKHETDYAVVVFTFLTNRGDPLATVTLGPTDTKGKTTFVHRIEDGKVPGKTRSVSVRPIFTRVSGDAYNHAFVDSMSLTISGV